MVFSTMMIRSRWLVPLMVASIVGLVSVSAGAKPRRAQAPPAAAAPASPEEAFLKAREALLQNASKKVWSEYQGLNLQKSGDFQSERCGSA